MGVSQDYLQIINGLYGLKQAGKLWSDLLSQHLTDYGFIKSIYDACIFVHSKDSLVLRLAVHVDDTLIIEKEQKILDHFINYLESKLTKVKCNKNTDKIIYLGITITRDRKSKIISLSQYDFATKVINNYLPEDSPISVYPINVNNILNDITKEEKMNLYLILWVSFGTLPIKQGQIYYTR